MDKSVPAVLADFEQRYRGDHKREHALLIDASGSVVTQNVGDFDSVKFDERDLEKARGGYVTHSHPRALPPSGPDLMLSANYNLLLRAVGNAPDTGQHIDYMVSVPTHLAKALAEQFDNEVERAEQKLSRLPLNDLAWQRESRHLAIRHLSRTLNFPYRRIEKKTPLSEATNHEHARLDVFQTLESQMQREVFEPLHGEVVRTLRRSAMRGHLAMGQIETLRTRLQSAVQRQILGPVVDNSLHPYLVRRGQITPHSPYFKVLWENMRASGQTAANRHAEMLRAYLPADMVRSLEYASVNPFETDISEMDDGPDLSGHDPLHLWTGPDGRRLLERLWNVAGDLYKRLDNFVSGAIATGQDVDQMDSALWTYLVEGKGDYEAMRLARTEVAATFSRVDSAAAALNPLVEQYQPFTSPQHKHTDVCDEQVANGPYPKNDTTHLPPYHPFCLCGVMWQVVEDIPAAVERLRKQIATALTKAKTAFTDLVGPLSKQFVDRIFGVRS